MSQNSFRSPFAALVWKEWRESWWLLALMFVGPTAATIVIRLLGEPKDAAWFANAAGLLLCLTCVVGLALSLGAGLFAAERARGTETLQLERPISRGTIWRAKMQLPALSLAWGVFLAEAMTCCMRHPDQWTEFRYFNISLFLPFAAAALCSVLLDRTLTAGAAGGVLSVIVYIGQVFLIAVILHCFGPSLRLLEPILTWLTLFEAVGLLWLSRLLYLRRRED